MSASFLHVRIKTFDKSVGRDVWGHKHEIWGQNRGDGTVRQFFVVFLKNIFFQYGNMIL